MTRNPGGDPPSDEGRTRRGGSPRRREDRARNLRDLSRSLPLHIFEPASRWFPESAGPAAIPGDVVPDGRVCALQAAEEAGLDRTHGDLHGAGDLLVCARLEEVETEQIPAFRRNQIETAPHELAV